MSAVADRLNEPHENTRRQRPEHPKGWEPGVEWTGTVGRITAPTDNSVPDWRSLLERWSFDPDEYEVIEPVQVRTWDAIIRLPDGSNTTQTMWYHRANIRRKLAGAVDIDELLQRIRRARKAGPARVDEPTRAFHVPLSDWQIGKKGTDATVERILDGFADAERRLLDLRRAGPIEAIYLPCLGDLFEGCKDHYDMQTYEVELDNRDQARVVRDLLYAGIDRFRRLGQVVVPAVGGNHGEERDKGKAYTSFSDNKDVAAVEAVMQGCARNPSAYGNVSFMLPRDDLAITFDAAGTIVAIAHGHQVKGMSGPAYKRIVDWWKGQMYGMRAAGDADLLLTGHLHQFIVHKDGARTLMVCPTIDSGSRWFAETGGIDSVPAMLTFTTAGGGWDDAKLL